MQSGWFCVFVCVRIEQPIRTRILHSAIKLHWSITIVKVDQFLLCLNKLWLIIMLVKLII